MGDIIKQVWKVGLKEATTIEFNTRKQKGRKNLVKLFIYFIKKRWLRTTKQQTLLNTWFHSATLKSLYIRTSASSVSHWWCSKLQNQLQHYCITDYSTYYSPSCSGASLYMQICTSILPRWDFVILLFSKTKIADVSGSTSAELCKKPFTDKTFK